MSEKELTPIEELGQAINIEVEKTGQVKGEVFVTEGHDSNRHHYPVTKSYSFLGRVVEEQVVYAYPSHLRERAVKDCVNDIRKVVNKKYDICIGLTSDRGKKEVAIRKPLSGYKGPIIIPSSWVR